eukprot:2063610-Amphidinium_carterae.2
MKFFGMYAIAIAAGIFAQFFVDAFPMQELPAKVRVDPSPMLPCKWFKVAVEARLSSEPASLCDMW